MKRRVTTREKLHFLQGTLSELERYKELGELDFSRNSVACIKQIINLLELGVYRWEMKTIDHLEMTGKMTPKEKVTSKAKVKKKYPRRIDRK